MSIYEWWAKNPTLLPGPYGSNSLYIYNVLPSSCSKQCLHTSNYMTDLAKWHHFYVSITLHLYCSVNTRSPGYKNKIQNSFFLVGRGGGCYLPTICLKKFRRLFQTLPGKEKHQTWPMEKALAEEVTQVQDAGAEQACLTDCAVQKPCSSYLCPPHPQSLKMMQDCASNQVACQMEYKWYP